MSGDPGLQPERTSLAWRRTGLAATTATLVLARVAVARDLPVVAAACIALAVVAVGALVEGSQRHAARRGAFDDERALVASPLLERATVAVVVALAAMGLVLVLAT